MDAKRSPSWFERSGRRFPWRRSRVSLYQRIVTEILLQRTQAETVARFYTRFFEQFPSWKVRRGEIAGRDSGRDQAYRALATPSRFPGRTGEGHGTSAWSISAEAGRDRTTSGCWPVHRERDSLVHMGSARALA